MKENYNVEKKELRKWEKFQEMYPINSEEYMILKKKLLKKIAKNDSITFISGEINKEADSEINKFLIEIFDFQNIYEIDRELQYKIIYAYYNENFTYLENWNDIILFDFHKCKLYTIIGKCVMIDNKGDKTHINLKFNEIFIYDTRGDIQGMYSTGDDICAGKEITVELIKRLKENSFNYEGLETFIHKFELSNINNEKEEVI